MTRCHLAAFEVDGQVADELLPVSAAVTPLNLNDPNYGMSDDEIAERNEFIRWHMQQEYIGLAEIAINT